MTTSPHAAIAYFDGAAEPNPGHGSAGWALQDLDGNTITTGHGYLGDGVTNNQAEYQALLAAVATALGAGIRDLTIRGDSQLVVKQAAGEWRCENPGLQTMLEAYQELAKQFDAIRIEWIPRHQNTPADDLSKRALEEAGIVVTKRDYVRRKAKATI